LIIETLRTHVQVINKAHDVTLVGGMDEGLRAVKLLQLLWLLQLARVFGAEATVDCIVDFNYSVVEHNRQIWRHNARALRLKQNVPNARTRTIQCPGSACLRKSCCPLTPLEMARQCEVAAN